MIADVVEDSELKTGRRQEGLFFAAAAFINKAVSGMGIFTSGMIISAIHFPKGVKPFMSDYAAGDYSFKRTLKKAGTYTFECDLHQGMKMTIVVK